MGNEGFWGTYVKTNPNDPWLKTLPSKSFKQVQVIIGAVRPRRPYEQAMVEWDVSATCQKGCKTWLGIIYFVFEF
jgi:hypothetical protein